MARIFITGSADGLGRLAARQLAEEGHEVVLHARSAERLAGVRPLLDRGAAAVTGDLADLHEVEQLAAQVNRIGTMDAVIHNAGVYHSGPDILPVNVVAPYVLSARLNRSARWIALSSGMHLSGRPRLSGLDWSGEVASASYSDSKLFVTTLTMALARLWPDVACNAVDPGWVPTKMGGPNAPDDLRLGHRTQEWLATSGDPEASSSGGYWHHQHRLTPHPKSLDQAFQTELLECLERATGVSLSSR